MSDSHIPTDFGSEDLQHYGSSDDGAGGHSPYGGLPVNAATAASAAAAAAAARVAAAEPPTALQWLVYEAEAEAARKIKWERDPRHWSPADEAALAESAFLEAYGARLASYLPRLARQALP